VEKKPIYYNREALDVFIRFCFGLAVEGENIHIELQYQADTKGSSL